MNSIILWAFLVCLLLPICATAQSAADSTLHIGVLAFRSKEATYIRWEPTAIYLSTQFPDFQFEILPLNFPELDQAVKDRSVDFVLTNSGHYVTLEVEFGIARLATLVKLVWGEPSSVFGGVIFCRADRQDIQTITDLHDHSFKIVSEFSLGGYLAARMELLSAGIDLNRDLGEVTSTGMPHDQVVMAVLAGEADAGTVRTSVLENMAYEGVINLDQIRILGPRRNDQFPILHSTALYPEWPLSSMPHINPQLGRSVAKALMEISADHPAAIAGQYHQWTIPLNYQAVHHMMRELRMGPYVAAGQFDRKDAMARFQTEILALAFIIALAFFAFALRQYHLNRQLVREMAERRAVEIERTEIKAALHRSQKMEAIGVLVGGVAHDLNNILTGLVSYPEMILLDLPEDSPVRQDVQTVFDMGERAAAVVADLLTVSRAVASAPDVLDVRNEVNDYRRSPEFSRLQMSFPFIKFRWQLEDCHQCICCSRSHLRSSLMNLVINAAEAINGRGKVSVSAHFQELEKPLVGYEKIPADQYVILSIQDSGPGISPANLERIFEPFFTRKVMGKSGTGLGLAIVWNTMRNHNGFIDLKSDPSGTRFDLYFQTACPDGIEQQSDISLSDLQGHGQRILVVDDEHAQREIACRMLQELGYKCSAVSSGEEAIAYLPENPVDMVMLDMIMDPGINGMQTFEELQKIDPHLKAMVASGYAETSAVQPVMALGARQFLHKPYNLKQLALAVYRTLDAV